MRAFVFTDPALASNARQFVWLEVDTERAPNAPFLEKFPIDAWPTFLVVDPRDEKVLLRRVGGMTVDQVRSFLDESLTAFSTTDGPGAAAALARADRLFGAGKNAEAARAYRDALRAAPDGWPPYGRAVESLMFALMVTGAKSDAVALAQKALPRLAGSPAKFGVAVSGLDAALSLPQQAPGQWETVRSFDAEVRKRLADPSLTVAADDRSEAYESLFRTRQQAKDDTSARVVAEKWSAYLAAEAARTRTPK